MSVQLTQNCQQCHLNHPHVGVARRHRCYPDSNPEAKGQANIVDQLDQINACGKAIHKGFEKFSYQERTVHAKIYGLNYVMADFRDASPSEFLERTYNVDALVIANLKKLKCIL